MSMKAGRLRHRISIQQKGESQDLSTGEMLVDSWVDFAKVWAAIEPLSARDVLAAQAVQSAATTRFVIRYRVGIDPTMRIVHRGGTYNIEGQPLPDVDSGLEYLTLLASSGVNDG